MSLEERYDELPDELKKKAKTCKSAEDLLKLAEANSIKLSDEEIEAISGGSFWVNSKCPSENNS